MKFSMHSFSFPSFSFVIWTYMAIAIGGGSCVCVRSITKLSPFVVSCCLKSSFKKVYVKFFVRIIGDWGLWKSNFMASRHIRPVREYEIIYVEQTWRPFEAVLRIDFLPCFNFHNFSGQSLWVSACKAVLLLKNNSLVSDSNNVSFPWKTFLDSFLNFVICWLTRNTKALLLTRFIWVSNVVFCL